jgi:hypothetical protein
MRYEDKIGKGFHRWSQGKYTPGQLEAFSDFENAFILLSGAYRSGKTEIGSRMCIRHAMFFPNAKAGVFRAHLANLRKSTLLSVLELIHPSWVKSWSNTYLEMELLNGSTISFIGADHSDRLGSIELTFAQIDESSEVNEESLGMIQGRLSGHLELPSNFEDLPSNIQQYLEQTVDIRQAVLSCNPKSTGHYLFQRFIKNPQPGHVVYNSNSVSNENLPKVYLVNNLSAYVKPGYTREWVEEQIDLIRSGKMPADGLHLAPALTPFGKRNLLGMWVAMEGRIYDFEDEKHFVKSVPEAWGKPVAHFAAVDFGFHNPRLAVFAEYKFSSSNQVQTGVAYVDGWADKKATGDELILACKKMIERYPDMDTIYFPHDQPGIRKTARRTLGSKYVTKAKTSVNAGINVVTRFVNTVRLLILSGAKEAGLAWEEVISYQWDKDRDNVQLDRPVKKDDHFPDAFRYGLYTRYWRQESKAIHTDEPEPELIKSPGAILHTSYFGAGY